MHCFFRYGLITFVWSLAGVYAVSAQQSQQERAESAMRESLERQRAAIEQMRDTSNSNSLQNQQESVSRQVSQVQGKSDTATTATGVGTQKQEPALASTDKPFFTVPWPDSAPLIVPNVQVVDESCQTLPQAQVDQLISGASKKWGVDSGLLRSVMRQESGFKACALSTAGAMGLMQIMPDTADSLGLDDPYDPAKNVAAGAKYLKMMLDRYQGNTSMALAAYNAGPGRVDKSGGIPQISETIQYITNILKSLPGLY
jgi:soluble lytic murein transglycosylase-like protein